MTYRNASYCAFYVSEPFSTSGLGAFATRDFCHYMALKMWKAQDNSFPFTNAHDKTYDVRDGSSWELTLKPRLHERLRHSKNIILFLSSHTKASRALSEEMEYGISTLGLPVIVVYTDFNPVAPDGQFDIKVYKLWSKLPAFERNMDSVPTIHIPMEKEALRKALLDPGYTVQNQYGPGTYRL